MQACEKLAQLRYGGVVNLRCQRLGEQLKLAKSLQGEGLEIKEGYDDHTLADDIELGFDLVGDSPASLILPSKLVPATNHSRICRKG